MAQDIQQRNSANAQLSTGPRTTEGKQKVSQNARKLGLFVSDATVEQEDPNEFAELLAGYTAEYCPLTCSEIELVRQLTVATHRLRRLDRIETAAMFTEQVAHTRHEGNLILSEQFNDYSTLLDKIERARSRAERTFTRCYKELEARKWRRPTPRTPPVEVQIEVDTRHESIPLQRNAKQTQTAVGSGSSTPSAQQQAPGNELRQPAQVKCIARPPAE